ncbi:hypothetical protein GOBAR_DD16921 [Gossypium barbadense]|nr:hypothetical protein GOBAR_DD16921 [Gossypium barbadense]
MDVSYPGRSYHQSVGGDDMEDKMLRRPVRAHRIVQGTPNSVETNSTEQQTAVGSSNVPVTPEEPIEAQSNLTFNLHMC